MQVAFNLSMVTHAILILLSSKVLMIVSLRLLVIYCAMLNGNHTFLSEKISADQILPTMPRIQIEYVRTLTNISLIRTEVVLGVLIFIFFL